MNPTVVFLLLTLSIMMNSCVPCAITPKNDDDGSDDKKDCYKEKTFNCCEGYVLEVQNETTAKCVGCIPAGQSCYMINRPCCPGYQCASGPVAYPEPRPTDTCISKMIRG